MGRTETIKQRAVYVYLPSIKQKESWEEYAKRQGASISRFVIEHVENSLRQEKEPSYKSRGQLWKEIKELQQQVKDLRKENRLLRQVVDKLEREARRYRAKPFLEESFEGVRHYQKELIDVLRSQTVVSNEQILSQLGIEPSEYEAVKAISKQLENLEAYGLVKPSPRGWKWMK